jgi:hypothetical protein
MAMAYSFSAMMVMEHTLVNMQANGIEIKNMGKVSVTMLTNLCIKATIRTTILMGTDSISFHLMLKN